MYNGSLAHRKVWPASRACAESNCMDISLNKVRAGGSWCAIDLTHALLYFYVTSPTKSYELGNLDACMSFGKDSA